MIYVHYSLFIFIILLISSSLFIFKYMYINELDLKYVSLKIIHTNNFFDDLILNFN